MSDQQDRPRGPWSGPDLVVGDIQIRNGQIRIGGVDVSVGSPTLEPLPPLAPVQPPTPPLPPPPGARATTPQSYPPAPSSHTTPAGPTSSYAGQAHRQAAPPPVPLASASTTTALSDAIATALRSASLPQAPTLRGQGLRMQRLLGQLMTYSAGGAVVLWLLAAILWIGVSVAVTTGVAVFLTLPLVVGLLLTRRAQRQLIQVSEAERHRQLLLLADRHGGVVVAADLVRELGVSFPEAERLLNQLASSGHASLEFDPRTQGPAWRLG